MKIIVEISESLSSNCDYKHRPHAQLFFICIELLPPCQIRSRKMQYGEAGNCLVRFCTHFVSPMCTYILKRSLRYYHIHTTWTVILVLEIEWTYSWTFRWTENSFPFFLYLKPVEISKKCFNII